MKQKIEVRVTAAVDDRWPKVVGEKDKCPSGSTWCVYQGAEFLHLCKIDVETTLDTKLGSLVPFASKICFPDFETLADWWTNPQPVKQEPEKVTIESLPNGSYFQFEGGEFVNVKTGQMNGTRYVFQAAGQHVGYAGTAMPSLRVIPFYGTITINVGREEQ